MKNRKHWLVTALLVCVVTATFWVGDRTVGLVSAVAKETYDNIEIFTNVLALVQKNYVDNITTKQLSFSGICPPLLPRGLATALPQLKACSKPPPAN